MAVTDLQEETFLKAVSPHIDRIELETGISREELLEYYLKYFRETLDPNKYKAPNLTIEDRIIFATTEFKDWLTYDKNIESEEAAGLCEPLWWEMLEDMKGRFDRKKEGEDPRIFSFPSKK